MTRNRRRRSEVSMKCAVGRGCLLLLAGVTCVAFSITKIIVGSEYVSSCPSREMIPIFVIVSGCLPVLLSALRQPYDSGHKMDTDRFSMRMSLVTALLGVMINLAWLVAGTYLVVTTWNGNMCTNNTSDTRKDANLTVCGTLLTTNISENFNNSALDSQDEICAHRDTNNLLQNMPVPSNHTAERPANSDYIKTGKATETNDSYIENDGKFTTGKLEHMPKDSVRFDEKTTNGKSCITCDKTILSFSLGVIVVDWLFVLFGALYFCYFVYYRFSSLKDQLLLINA